MGSASEDYLYRFLFEEFGVRGEFVRLDASWKAVQERHDYPGWVKPALGQTLTAVTLLSGTIKFKGSLTLQLKSDSDIQALIAQATEQRTIRGMAQFVETPQANPDDMTGLLGDARLILTTEAPNGERYQGIVAVEGGDVVKSVEQYFEQSEQLPTRLWMAGNDDVFAGLFLQRLPQSEIEDEDWSRVCMLADTIKDDELLTLDVETLLHRLFHEESVRLFDPEPVAFRCSCSRERVANTLVSLGEGEVTQILEELGSISVDCEFCNANYRFDAIDAAALFKEAESAPPQVQ